MRIPLVLGMGPNRSNPKTAWHPTAPATRGLCWLTLGEWDSLFKLEKKLELLNLNGEYFSKSQTFNGRDAVESQQAAKTLDRLLRSDSLSKERHVILLGKDVTEWVGKNLKVHHVLKWGRTGQPSVHVKGDINRSSPGGATENYHFSFHAHVIPHPSNFCGPSHRRMRTEDAEFSRKTLHGLVMCNPGPLFALLPVERPSFCLEAYSSDDRQLLDRRFGIPADIQPGRSLNSEEDFIVEDIVSDYDFDTMESAEFELQDELAQEVEANLVENARNADDGWPYSDDDES